MAASTMQMNMSPAAQQCSRASVVRWSLIRISTFPILTEMNSHSLFAMLQGKTAFSGARLPVVRSQRIEARRGDATVVCAGENCNMIS